MLDKAKPLESPFMIPCRVVELDIVSKVVAQQYGFRYSNLFICSDRDVYGGSFLDIGLGPSTIRATLYMIVQGFDIRGHDAYLLEQILKRSSGIVIEDHGDKISVLYSI